MVFFCSFFFFLNTDSRPTLWECIKHIVCRSQMLLATSQGHLPQHKATQQQAENRFTAEVLSTHADGGSVWQWSFTLPQRPSNLWSLWEELVKILSALERKVQAAAGALSHQAKYSTRRVGSCCTCKGRCMDPCGTERVTSGCVWASIGWLSLVDLGKPGKQMAVLQKLWLIQGRTGRSPLSGLVHRLSAKSQEQVSTIVPIQE